MRWCNAEQYWWWVHYFLSSLLNICCEFFPAMATGNNLPVFWSCGFQFFLQHDIYISILPYAGGRFIPRTYCWFCNDVPLRRNLYDCILVTLLFDWVLNFQALVFHGLIEKYTYTWDTGYGFMYMCIFNTYVLKIWRMWYILWTFLFIKYS